MKLPLLLLILCTAVHAAERLTANVTLYFEGPSKLVLADEDRDNFKACFTTTFSKTHKKLNHQAWTIESLEVRGSSFYTGVRNGHNHMPMREPHFPNLRKRVDQQKAVDFIAGFSASSLRAFGNSETYGNADPDAVCGLCAPSQEEFPKFSETEKEIMIAERQWMSEMCDCLDEVFIHGHDCWVEFHEFW